MLKLYEQNFNKISKKIRESALGQSCETCM